MPRRDSRVKKRTVFCEGLTLCFATSVFIATVVAHGLASLTNGNGHLGFQNSTESLWTKYPTEISPALWVNAIWGVIYTWQALWIIYGWSFVCRATAKRTIPLVAYAFFSVSCALFTAWLFLWGNEIIVGSFPFIPLALMSLALTLAYVLWATYRKTFALRAKYQGDLWATRIIVHNGIAFYISWLAFIWPVQLTVVVSYYSKMQANHAATMSLTILFVEVLSWFVLEHTYLDRFARYIHSVYIVIIVAMSAVVVRHWNNEEDDIINRSYSLALLAFTGFAQVCKIVLAVVYSYLKPIDYPSTG